MHTRRRGAGEPGAHLLVAVKALPDAKSRLSQDYVAVERTELVLAMLRDTLAAATGSSAVAHWSVVTPDPRVAALASELGGTVVAEPVSATTPATTAADRLNAALVAAESVVRAQWSGDIVVLQADLPALRPDEIDAAYARARTASRERAIVVDHTGTGTSALFAVGDRTELRPCFGPNSAREHEFSGAITLTGAWPGLRLDVDTAADLDAASSLGLGEHTRSALARAGRGVRCARAHG